VEPWGGLPIALLMAVFMLGITNAIVLYSA